MPRPDGILTDEEHEALPEWCVNYTINMTITIPKYVRAEDASDAEDANVAPDLATAADLVTSGALLADVPVPALEVEL